jgi:hypothetical protein
MNRLGFLGFLGATCPILRTYPLCTGSLGCLFCSHYSLFRNAASSCDDQ